MIVIDHGFLRLCYNNFHKVNNDIYRSNMPTPLRIKKYSKLGIKTIINLRGARKDGGWLLENEACIKYNIKLIDFKARSRAAPDKEMIFNAEKLFNTIQYPALIHCKSGADRAGIMCALYILIKEKKDAIVANKQLSWKYLHLKWAKTGILGSFVEEYRSENEKTNVKFMDWVRKNYDPLILEQKYKSNWWVNKLVNNILKRE